jgi:hypothetical protein
VLDAGQAVAYNVTGQDIISHLNKLSVDLRTHTADVVQRGLDDLRTIAADVVQRGLDALEQRRLEEMELLQSNLSTASSTFVSTVLRRLQVMRVTAPYSIPPLPLPQRQPYAWPRVPAGQGGTREDEVSGYETAVPWLQQHVAPPGVAVLDKHSEDWLSWCVHQGGFQGGLGGTAAHMFTC